MLWTACLRICDGNVSTLARFASEVFSRGEIHFPKRIFHDICFDSVEDQLDYVVTHGDLARRFDAVFQYVFQALV